ncbi:MAG: ABC transporter permease [Firmicutes bacterium]|nr:ABC transporter permease [Bacillota bacterium]
MRTAMEMKILFQLALRNLFRNKRRTLLTMTLVILAVAFLLTADTYMNGMINNVTEDAVKTSGHIRIQNKKFTAAERMLPIQHNISGYDRIRTAVQHKLPDGAGVTGQIRFPSMLYGPEKNTVGLGFAIEPAAAEEILQLSHNIIEGRALGGGKDDGHGAMNGSGNGAGRNEVVLGKELAQRLQVKVGETVSAFAKSQYGSFSGVNLIVVGISDLGFSKFNKIFYLPLSTAQNLLEMDNQVTSILIMLKDQKEIAPAVAALRRDKAVAGYDVIPYTDNVLLQQLLPIVRAVVSILLSFFLIIGILGITNTMSMAVMERIHEIAVMGALGLKRRKVIALILLESGMIGVIGSLIGLILGLAMSWYLVNHGIVLNDTARGLPISVKSVVYGQLNPVAVVRSFLIGSIAAVVSAFFPARRAARIEPAAAMRM